MYGTDGDEFLFEDDVLEPSPACLALPLLWNVPFVERTSAKSYLPPSFFEHFLQQLPANEAHLPSERSST